MSIFHVFIVFLYYICFLISSLSISLYYLYDVVCCILIKITYLWNMRWRAPDQEVDQRGQASNLNKEDAMDRGRWKKLIKTG